MSEIARSSAALALPQPATETGLDLPEGMPVEQWQETGETLSQIDRACRWWIGDWLKYGEREYGERYAFAAVATGYSKQTLMDAVWVARKVPKSRRVKRLSFSHHKAVASLKTAAEQERHLADAERNNWSVSELRERINKEATANASPTPSSKGLRTGPDSTPDELAAPIAGGSKESGMAPDKPRSPADKVRASADCAVHHAAVLRKLLTEVGPAVQSDLDTAKSWHEGFCELADIAAQLADETLKAINAGEHEREGPVEAANPAEEAEAERLAAKFKGLAQ